MTITIIGAGNVGYHLAKGLTASGHRIVQQFSRNPARFEGLYPDIVESVCTDLSEINLDSDIYIIAVSDTAIPIVADQLPPVKGIIAHTSGSVPSTVLKAHQAYGIFYPLQTFSRHQLLNFSAVPFCIDGHTAEVKDCLMELAASLSQSVYSINDEQRALLHVAAVFANNFTNHLLAVSYQLCEDFEVPFEVIQPLILETAQKAVRGNPADVQTGPAIRGDQTIIKKHLKTIEAYPKFTEIYRLISDSIITKPTKNTGQ